MHAGAQREQLVLDGAKAVRVRAAHRGERVRRGREVEAEVDGQEGEPQRGEVRRAAGRRAHARERRREQPDDVRLGRGRVDEVHVQPQRAQVRTGEEELVPQVGGEGAACGGREYKGARGEDADAR